MRGNDGWAGDSFLQVHNWWHLALYHLEIGEIDAVLALFDEKIGGGRSGVVMDLVDASALLWRLARRHPLASPAKARRHRKTLQGGQVRTLGAFSLFNARPISIPLCSHLLNLVSSDAD